MRSSLGFQRRPVQPVEVKMTQMTYFQQYGYGRGYPMHRLGAMIQVPALVSYFMARNSDLKEQPFVIQHPSLLYTAEIQYKEQNCGVVMVFDDTEQRDFETGQTYYSARIMHYKDISKENFKEISSDIREYRGLEYFSAWGQGHMSTSYMERDQDNIRGKEWNIQEFEKNFTEHMRQKIDSQFAVAALL